MIGDTRRVTFLELCLRRVAISHRHSKLGLPPPLFYLLGKACEWNAGSLWTDAKSVVGGRGAGEA